MEISNFMLTVMAGIAGTVGMTLVMYGYAALAGQNTRVIEILGKMLTGSAATLSYNRWKSTLAGTIAHFGVGLIFSWSYFLLWNWGVFTLDFGDSLLVGFFSGLIAFVVWGSYFILHYHPPKIDLFHYFLALVIAHVVFGLITVNLYALLCDQTEFWFEFRQRINAMR